MPKQGRGGGLEIAVLLYMGNKLVIGMEPGLRKAGNSFVDLGVEKRFTGAIKLNEGRYAVIVEEVRVIV